MRLIPGANTNAGRGSSGMTLIERKKDDEQQSELDRIIEEDRKNQERLQNEETQRLADQQNKKNESAADKALNTVADYAVAGFGVASRVVKGGLDAYNAASDFIVKTAEEHPKIAEAVLGTTPVGNAYKLKKQVDSSVQDAFDRGVIDEKTKNWIDDPVLTALNTETGAKITGEVAKSTSNLPLKAIARVKAIGDDTYDEALSSLMEWRNNPESPRWQKLLADVQDSGAQSAVGVLLSVGASFITRSPKAGQAVGMTYYGAISAESQRQEKGSVTSKKNIAVDTIGDIALGGLVESSLKAIIKDSAKRTAGNVAAQTVKGAIVEGSTEVSQTMVKYANDYNDAKSDEEKLSVIDKTKNYVLNGGLLNEFLVGGISGGVITGFATMAGVAATGNDGVDPSLQPKKPGSDEEKKGSPSLSADVDIAKLRDQAITFKESAEKNQDNPVALEQYAAVRDALSDYEIAFKERPVYIAQNEQESPLMQIETVAYPDGKFSYRFSADVGSTSLDSNFDNQDTVGSQEEAIKKASETIKSWVEEQLSNAADNEEAIKFQRIFDEADALLSGKAKFESALPSIKETAQTSEEQLSKESGEATNQVNDNAPGLASFDSTDPINQRYIKTAVSSDTLESFQKNLDESTLISRIAPDVQMDDRTGVYRAIKAFYESYHTKKDSVQPVDKSEKKEEKPVTKKDEKPEPVEETVKDAQPKEKTEAKNETELEAPKKPVRRFGQKSEVKNTDVGEKIGGARKDLYQETKDSIMKEYSASEIADLPREKAIPTVDYQSLIANGTSEEALGTYTFFVSVLGKKIRTSRSKFSRYIQGVQALRTFAQGMVTNNERLNIAVEELSGKDLSMSESIAMYKHFDFINNEAIRPYSAIIRSWRYTKDGDNGELHHDFTLSKNGTSIRGVNAKTQAEFYSKVAEYLSVDKKARGKANIADSISVFLVTAARTPVVGYKKNGKFIKLEQFETTEEARAAKKEKIDEYVKKVEELTNFDESSFRGNENTHVGKSYRDGRDVTADEFMRTFGFRGVEFGNWVTQAERIPRLNMAYDSFKELAVILGVPDTALSLNGELGFAFGSRGVVGALAHYEPDKVVINITKENGAGTIAHEWWHALDNYLSRKSGRSTNFVTGTRNYPREELKTEVNNLMDFIKKSDVYKRSVQADGYKGKPYFVLPTELGARAFEVYVKNKMIERGTQNDFLVNVSDIEDLEKSFMGEIYPYAVGEEAKKLTETMQQLVSTLQVDDEGAIFSKADRSTRGKDGKFTGSNAIDAITTDKIEKYISNGQAFETVRRIQKETNPALRAALQYRIAWDLLSNGGDDGFVTQGLFRVKKGMVETSLQLTPDEFENVLRHEINHAAFVMLPRDKQMEIEEWYIDISNDVNREKEFIGLYDDQPGMVYDYMKRAMQASKKGLLVNWDGTEKSVITFMADETFNRYMNSRGDKPLRGVEKIYRDMVSAIVRLLERINQATFKNKRFSAKAKKRALDEMYKDVFNPNGGTFVPPAGYLDFLGKQGVIPGEIQFGNDGKNIDIDQAPERMVASAKKEKETKTVRFSKIISRRRELRELKRKREAAFLATEEGQQVAAEAEINRENYEAPNENIVQGIKNSTYFQKEGSISDAMGEGYLMEKNGRYVVAEAGRRDVYVQRGYQTVMEIDSFASEAGFDSGTDYLRDQFDRRKLPDTAGSAIRRILNDRDKIYGKVDEELKKLEIELSEAKDGKGAFYQGMRIGSTIARKKYNERLKVFRDRKAKVRAAKDFFGLSDSEFKKIGGARDIQTMGESEFQGFLNHIQVQAEKSILRSQAMELLVGQIQEKQLKRYDNLRRAMKLPAIDKMTTEQIKEFDAALEFSQEGDEFFTQRQLETVKNTELKWIKTVREARERLSARINMPLTSLGSIQVAPSLDRLRFDAAIAEANPFYWMIVAETNTATLEAESRFMAIEEQANKLIKAARKSRSRGIIDRLTPKDSRIFSYLESTDKSGLALDMTKEELEAAEFIRRSYEEMRDYLVKNGMLEKYRENYITHVRKGFLETLRDDGIVEAFRDLIAQQQEDEATFNILSADTGNILPLEKFFQFSLKRTGGIKPTENVATAFLSYTRAFEKKRALDGLIPKLDIYTYSIEPKRATKTGLLMDRSLKRFLNDYLNNKKGRRFDFGGFLRQGGKADLALRSVRALTTILDLGLSLPGGIASNVGEQSTNFVQMGVKAYIKGSARYATFKGRRFLKKYRNFTGKNPWSELAEASKGVGDRFNAGLFILFRDAQVRANQQFLLGSITDEEYKTGEITPQRLGELNIAMGRWRVVDGAKSIIGSTSAGGVLTQYKTWAVPIFRTTLKDITTIVGNIKDKGLAKALYSREGAELFRSIMVLGTVALIVKSLVSSDKDTEKEKTFFEKLVDKSVRDLLSTIGVFDPTFFASEPRVLAFFGDLAAAIKSIGLLEEYADDASDGSYEAGDLKGAKKLKKTITPMLIKQFDASGNTPNKETSVEKYLKQGLSTEDAAAKAAEELNLDPESDDYESDLKAIEKEAVRQATVAALGDKTTARIEKARLNTTKMRILNDAKNEMTDQEFQAYIEKLYDGKIISKTIFQEFWNY